MNHPRELDLIELAAGHLTEQARRQTEEHLATCATCRRVANEIAAVHRGLGAWEPPAGSRDAWTEIERALSAPRPLRLRPLWQRASWAIRVAAAVLIGVGMGHFAGRLTLPPGQVGPLADAEPADAAAAEELSLYVFESTSPSGLFSIYSELMAGEQESQEVQP